MILLRFNQLNPNSIHKHSFWYFKDIVYFYWNSEWRKYSNHPNFIQWKFPKFEEFSMSLCLCFYHSFIASIICILGAQPKYENLKPHMLSIVTHMSHIQLAVSLTIRMIGCVEFQLFSLWFFWLGKSIFNQISEVYKIESLLIPPAFDFLPRYKIFNFLLH